MCEAKRRFWKGPTKVKGEDVQSRYQFTVITFDVRVVTDLLTRWTTQPCILYSRKLRSLYALAHTAVRGTYCMYDVLLVLPYGLLKPYVLAV